MPTIVILCPFHHVVERIDVPREYDASSIGLSGYRSFAGHIPCGATQNRQTVYVDVTFDQSGGVYVKRVLRAPRAARDDDGLRPKPYSR